MLTSNTHTLSLYIYVCIYIYTSNTVYIYIYMRRVASVISILHLQCRAPYKGRQISSERSFSIYRIGAVSCRVKQRGCHRLER